MVLLNPGRAARAVVAVGLTVAPADRPVLLGAGPRLLGADPLEVGAPALPGRQLAELPLGACKTLDAAADPAVGRCYALA